MSSKCPMCHVRDSEDATPVRAMYLTLGLVAAHDLDTVISHLCERHRRTLDQGLVHSKAMARKLFGLN